MAQPDSKKILIVEDDLDTVDALTLVLHRNGYQTFSAPDANNGLEKAKAERPDLILLDVMMPAGTEGFHFVWTLRKDTDPVCRDVPIIVLTAIHESSPMRLYPDQTDNTYGPYEYLPVQAFFDKPVDMGRLLSEIERLLA